MSFEKAYKRDVASAWLYAAPDVEIQCKHFDRQDPSYTRNMTKLVKPVKKLVELDALDPKKDREIAVTCFVQMICVNWRTIITPATETVAAAYRPEIEDAGQWFPYSEEKCIEIFLKYPQAYQTVVDSAREIASFQLSDTDVKN